MIKIHCTTFSISNKNTEEMTEKLIGISDAIQFKDEQYYNNLLEKFVLKGNKTLQFCVYSL